MKTIDEDIKNKTFSNIYLLYGEEGYLRQRYKNKLKSALSSEGDTINSAFYSGKDINPKELIDLAETMPFFSDKRLILVEDSKFFSESNEAITALADYLSNVPETTYFVFSQEKVNKTYKLYKQIKEHGKIIEFSRLRGADLEKWALSLIRKEGKNITRDGIRELMERVGDDMNSLNTELEKLFCYTGDTELITREAVVELVPEQIQNKIFAMVDAIVESRRKNAIELYYDLLALKEEPRGILAMITRQYNILLNLKGLKESKTPESEMARKAGIPDFALRKNLRQAERLSKQSIMHVLDYALEMDERMNTGRVVDKIAVEMIIMEASKSVV